MKALTLISVLLTAAVLSGCDSPDPYLAFDSTLENERERHGGKWKQNMLVGNEWVYTADTLIGTCRVIVKTEDWSDKRFHRVLDAEIIKDTWGACSRAL